MKNKLSRILCTALCCAPLLATAQTSENITSPQRLYQEGQSPFYQKHGFHLMDDGRAMQIVNRG